MKDIGILTYHNNSNRGAILQAYCLQRAVSQIIPNHNVEIIDYRTRSKELIRIFSKYPSELLEKWFDRNTSIDFLDVHAALSDERLITDNRGKAIDFLEKLEYDMIIVGSDVVWRVHEEDDGFSFRRPFPNAYFLDPSLDTYKASYAASSDQTDISMMSEEHRSQLSRYIRSFDKISVRDNHTEDLLRRIGIENFRRVPDPTLLVDLPHKDVSDKLKSKGIDPQKPILGIHCSDAEPFKAIVDHYREKGYQIVSMTRSEFSDANIYPNNTPFEYFSFYSYFDMVVTSSLHTTIFSVKNMVPFIAIDISPAYRDLESKMHSFLEEVNLLDRYINAIDEYPDNLVETMSEKESVMNEQEVQENIDELRQRGEDYIIELEKEL